MAYWTKHLPTIGKLILVILCGPVVVIIALAVGQLYALMVLLALPFILAFEVIDRKIEGPAAASPDPDELEKTGDEERADLPDTSQESPKTPAERQGFEPFAYTERN